MLLCLRWPSVVVWWGVGWEWINKDPVLAPITTGSVAWPDHFHNQWLNLIHHCKIVIKQGCRGVWDKCKRKKGEPPALMKGICKMQKPGEARTEKNRQAGSYTSLLCTLMLYITSNGCYNQSVSLVSVTVRKTTQPQNYSYNCTEQFFCSIQMCRLTSFSPFFLT